MASLTRWRDYRIIPLLLAAMIVVVVACMAAAWLGGGEEGAGFVSLGALRVAYYNVVVDQTSQRQLTRLGFNSGHGGARSLSGLGVQEYFMPRTSRGFDRLDPAVRSCFDAEDRCTALVIPLAATETGGALAAHAASPGGRIVFLLRSGRVVYKGEM